MLLLAPKGDASTQASLIGQSMRYFFHNINGDRQIDWIGSVIDNIDDARTHAVRQAGKWIMDSPELLVTHQDCRVEVTDVDNSLLFTVIMFSVNPKIFEQQASNRVFHR